MDMNQVNNSEPQRKSLWSERILHGVLRLRKNITVPLALLIILSAGTFSGIGFFMQNQNLEAEISRLESNSELQSLKMSNEWLKNRVAVLQEERAHLLDTAVADLNEKGMLIESILESVGVDIKVKVSKENSGGPFTGSMGATKDQLILRTDKYLDAIKDVPLGAPVPGVLTSRFGWRKDPINGKSAYHQGVDIRGRAGSEVLAFVLIDHGNGFNTKYAHMKKSLVKKGKIIERGQVIGLVGSSGRSTGPHVHYEIHYDDKILNPTRFVRVAKYLNRPKKKQ
jgi:murein DD-endopeptidase MepM/ murein hydrolase activator NlpD